MVIMKHEITRTREPNPATHRISSLGRSALRILPHQRRRQQFEQAMGTDEQRREAYKGLRNICVDQFAAAAETGKVVSVPTPESEGKQDRLVFETPGEAGQRRLMIVDRHTPLEASPILGDQFYNIRFFQPQQPDQTRKSIEIGLSDPLIKVADIRYTEVVRTNDRTMEALAENPATSTAAFGSQNNGDRQLLSADLAAGLTLALRESDPIDPNLLRAATVVEQALPELPAGSR